MCKKILTAIILLLITKTFAQAFVCTGFGEFKEFDGHYYAVSKNRLTFNYAKTYAQAGGGNLAIPNNNAENEFLASLAFGNNFAWIGVWDPNESNNYCYENGSCSYDISRFKTIDNSALTYSNWAQTQPDNLLKVTDVNSMTPIVPLGEHWVALNSVNTKWYDFGNHNDAYNNPVKHVAIYEFNAKPDCYNEPDIEKLLDLRCNTSLTQDDIQDEQANTTYKCELDANGTPYCPANLAACQNTQNKNDGFSKDHTGIETTREEMVCPTGTNMPSDCSGSYPNTWLKDMYTTLLSRCPDQSGYNYWKSEIDTYGHTQTTLQPIFCAAASRNNEACGSATPSSTTCYGSSLENVTVKQPVTTTSSLSCPSGGTLSGTTCNKTCSSISSYSCPSGGTLSGSTCTISSTSTSTYNATLVTTNKHYPVYEYGCAGGGWSKHASTSYPLGCGTPADFNHYWNCNQNGCWGVSYSAANCKTTTDSVLATIHWQGCSFASYSCPSGGTLSGSTCTVSSTSTSTYSATANYTYYPCPYAATCPTGTNLPSQCTGSYPNTWLKDMYTTLLSRCPDQSGYNYWKSEIDTYGHTQTTLQPIFCAAASRNNEPCGSATPSATTCYGSSLQNVTVQQPVTTKTALVCPTGTNMPSDCSGTYSNTWLKQMYLDLLSRCPDQAGYNYWKGEIDTYGHTQTTLQPIFCEAADRNNEPCGSATPSSTTCYGSKTYSYYTYHCDTNLSIYGESFVVQDSGGIHSTSSTPPTNNCVQQNYVCGENPEQRCADINGVWKCSENPCVDGDDIEQTDTQLGSQDGDDDGWNRDTGACNGQLYLFSGTSNKCRSDMKFGNFLNASLTIGTAGIITAIDGSNCCDDNAVLFGLIKCKADEKLLAQKRSAKQCRYNGEFCSKKIKLGFAKICIEKSKSYCCYNSTLAKIINEHGKEQLGKGWGSADNPNCKGFTPEEFQKLDLSKIDFQEAFSDIQINAQNISIVSDNIKNKISNIQNK